MGIVVCARAGYIECNQQLSAACCSQSARAAAILVTGNLERYGLAGLD